MARSAETTNAGAAQAQRASLGQLQAAVMDVVWDEGGWLTSAEVHGRLDRRPPLAYTTVMTILVRLWQKGRLERTRRGKAFAYRALQSREEFAAARMGAILAGAGDPAATLSRFLTSIGPEDREQLRRLLRQRT